MIINIVMASRSDIQSQIVSNQQQLGTVSASITYVSNILNNGNSGYDQNGNATLTYAGNTYLVSTLNDELTQYQVQAQNLQNTIYTLNQELPLASTTDTTYPSARTSTILRSYQHASRIFVDSNYRLSPKYGFLFYVEFDFNPLVTNVSNKAAQELGMIVKSVNLPKFTIDHKIHNAYNRKNIVQNKISYDPVTFTFHDDQADNVRQFWYDYYSFFYRDSDYADSTYNIISKYQERPSFDWGYSPRPVGSYISANAYQEYQYIQAIRIYSLYQNNFSEYELINPTITSFRHGEHSNSENTNLLEHQMTVQFETVKYQTGYTTENTVGGFIDLHYDTTPSPLGGVPASTTASQTVTDLAYYNMSMAGGSVVPQPMSGLVAAGAAAVSGSSTSAAGVLTPSNGGGFAIPAIGSLNSGGVTATALAQQASASVVSLLGSATGAVAGGIVGGVTSGLGSNGTAIVGLAAAAIANPSAVASTATNMGLALATGFVSAEVTQGASALASGLNSSISSGLTTLNTQTFAFSDGTPFTSGVSQSVSNWWNGLGFVDNSTVWNIQAAQPFVGPLPFDATGATGLASLPSSVNTSY